MPQSDYVKRFVFADGGDGSTMITIVFQDDSEIYQGPDVPYDGRLILEREADGRWSETVEEG